MRIWFTILLFCLFQSILVAQVELGCITIDFESIPNSIPAPGLILSDQYKESFGVTFSLEGGGSPMLAKVGDFTQDAFGSAWGSNVPAPGVDIGEYFLTDDGILSGTFAPPIILTFDVPIDTFSGCILDMDFDEQFVIQAMDEFGTVIVDTLIRAGDLGTGDGALTCWGFNLPGCEGTIHSIKYEGFRSSGAFGLGMDYFSFCYSALYIDVDAQPETCNSLGSMKLIYPESQGYTFSLDSIYFSGIDFFDELLAGEYTVYVRDKDGCETSVDINIPRIDPEVVDIIATNTTCGEDNGVVEIDPGNTQGAMYSLDEIVFQESNVFDSLPPDIYTFFVRDSFGCIALTGETILPSTAPEIAGTSLTNDSCRKSIGEIAIQGAGGATSYSIDGLNYQAENIFTGLTEGTYEIWAKDALECTISDSVTLTTTEEVIIFDLVAKEATCNNSNGFIEILLSSGTGPFTYSLDSLNWQTDSLILEVPAGPYQVYVLDSNECDATQDVVVPQPPVGEIQEVEEEHTICNEANGSVTIVPTLNAGNTYSIDGIEFSANNNFSDLSPGLYIAYLLDENDCPQQRPFEILPSKNIEVTSTETVIDSCDYAKGTITVVGISENGDVSYSLDGAIPIPEGYFTNLTSGNYNVELSDPLGCREEAKLFVDNTPGIVIASVDVTTPECYEDNGVVEVNAQGGVGILDYVLLDTINESIDFSPLPPGSYDLIITDDLGCLATRAIEVPYPYCPIYIPNVISHKQQDPDDLFRIFTHPKYQASVMRYSIYDRWGELVYLSERFNIHSKDKYFWDGRIDGQEAEQDSYTYLIEVLHPNQTLEKFAGSVMFLR